MLWCFYVCHNQKLYELARSSCRREYEYYVMSLLRHIIGVVGGVHLQVATPMISLTRFFLFHSIKSSRSLLQVFVAPCSNIGVSLC